MGISNKIVKNIEPDYNESTDNVRKQVVRAKSDKYSTKPDEIVKNII